MQGLTGEQEGMADRGRGYRLHAQVGYRLRVANQIAVELFAELLGTTVEGERITTGQFAVLSTLWERSGMAQTELAQHTSMDMPTLNGVLKRLSARGLIDVTVDENDKRYRVIGLTPAGRALSEELRAQGHLVSDSILRPLAPKERAQLLDLLGKLIAAHRPGATAAKDANA